MDIWDLLNSCRIALKEREEAEKVSYPQSCRWLFCLYSGCPVSGVIILASKLNSFCGSCGNILPHHNQVFREGRKVGFCSQLLWLCEAEWVCG